VYPVLNEAPHHEDIRGSGGIAPCIFNLGNGWRLVVSFTPLPLYLGEGAPSIHWIGGWVSLRASVGAETKREILDPARN